MGILRSSGVLFPVLMQEFGTTRERTAWVSSLSLSMSLLAAPLLGHLIEKFGCRLVAITGALTIMMGLVTSSFVQNLELLYFTYGALTGLGACACRTSAFLVVAMYFNKRRSFATGSVTMGPSLGMFMWGPVTQVLLDSVGWRNTFRIMAACCCLIIIAAVTYNPNVEEKDKMLEKVESGKEKGELDNEVHSAMLQTTKEKGKIVDLSVFMIPQYCILVASFTLMFLCRFIPNIHLVKYSEELNITAEKASKYYMFLGLSSAVGRLLSGRLCDVKCVNIQYVNQLAIAITGMATVLLPLARTFVSVAFYTVVFGFADGAFMTTQNVILLSIVGPERRATAFGFGNMLCAFAVASGPPLAGLIADKLGSYQFAFYAAGSLILISGAVQFLLLCFKSTAKGKQTQRQLVTMVTSEKLGNMTGECTDNKEYLASLYVQSALEKNNGKTPLVQAFN